MNDRKKRAISPPLRPFYRWHRRVGIVAALFVITLAVTGIILNHNADLNLQKIEVANSWLLSLYDIKSATSEYSYPQKLMVDQIILDIHTGRFFGKFGIFIMDIAAILLLLLSFSGIYMWRKRASIKRGK